MAQGYMDSLLRASTKVNRGSSGNVETNIGQTEMPDPGEDKARFDLWRQLSPEQKAKLLNEAKVKEKTDAQKFQEGKARQDKRTKDNLKTQSDLKERLADKAKKEKESVAKAEKKKIDKVQSERDKIKLEFVPYKRKLAQSNDEINNIQRQIDGLDAKYPNYNDVLDNIASIAQEIAYLQVLDTSKVDVATEIIELSTHHSPELIQLIYQIAINSKKDLSMAPSAREGFTMAILRMFAFQPSDTMSAPKRMPDNTQKKIKKSEPLVNGKSAPKKAISSKNWTKEVSRMNIRGAVKQLAANCFFDHIDNDTLHLNIHSENEHQMIERAVDGLHSYLVNHYEGFNKVIIQIEKENGKTLAGEEKMKNEEQIIMNESRASSDPILQEYVDLFDATIEEKK